MKKSKATPKTEQRIIADPPFSPTFNGFLDRLVKEMESFVHVYNPNSGEKIK